MAAYNGTGTYANAKIDANIRKLVPERGGDMSNTDDENLIFLSYAKPDKDRVLEFYDYLDREGFKVWMDVRRIPVGALWEHYIPIALQKAAIVVVFVSENSVTRRGYIQREIKDAIVKAKEKLIDDIYLIPVMLDDDIDLPHELKDRQAVWNSNSECKELIADAITSQLEKLGEATLRAQGDAKLRWSLKSYKDHWDGLPGYNTKFQLLEFRSNEYHHVSEITDIVRGQLFSHSMAFREVKYDQDSTLYNFGQEREWRQNTWEAICGDPIIKERILSFSYTVWLYYAGAAHGSDGVMTFAFTLDPVTHINALEDIFENLTEAFSIIQTEVRRQLSEPIQVDGEETEEPLILDQDMIEMGTNDWSDFSKFLFEEDGIKIVFPSYHVAAFCYGPQQAKISYDLIKHLLRRHYSYMLGFSPEVSWPEVSTAEHDEKNKGS